MEKLKIQKIPQPKTLPIVGNAHQLDSERPVQSIIALAKDHGEILRLSLAGNLVTFLSSQRLVHEACSETRFGKKVFPALQQLRAFAGDGLFTAETSDANWEKAHRILMPVFGPVAIQAMFGDMLDISKQMFTKWERLGDDAVVDVSDNMTRLTLDTIALTAFSYRFNSFYQNEMHPFVDAMVGGLSEAGARSRRPELVNQILLSKKSRYEENVRFMHELADGIILKRKHETENKDSRDLLDVMLKTQDAETGEKLEESNIRYQMVTFLIAGHETTSGLLSFAIYELLQNPEALRKARAEVDHVLGDREMTVQDIPQLLYIDQILKETLRLWPTAPAFAVYPFKDEILGGNYEVKAGDTLFVLSAVLHRDPAIWEEPDRFDPDRMIRQRFDRLPPNCWKPFGNGARGCIGRSFAMQEAILVLAKMIRDFDFALEDPSYRLTISESLTMKPSNLKIRIKPRRKSFLPQPNPETAKAQRSRPFEGQITHSEHQRSLSIFYGSNTGSSLAFARRIAQDAEAHGYSVILLSLDDSIESFPKDEPVIVVSSSYNGQAPDNARKFMKWVESLDKDALAKLPFAVFGCGNKDWSDTYQAIPKRIDEALARAGGQRFMTRGEADARADFFGDFQLWYRGFWEKMEPNAENLPSLGSEEAVRLKVHFVEPARAALLNHHGLEFGKVKQVKQLVDMSKASARSKIHVEIELPEGLDYRPGDYVSLLPSNPSQTVSRVLKRFSLTGETQIQVSGNTHPDSHFPVDRLMTVSEILFQFFELNHPATRRQILELAEATPCPPEKKGLLRFLENAELFETEIVEKRISVLDLLERHLSCGLSFASFLSMLPPMKPRQYSISSSPSVEPRRCTLTVAVVDSQAYHGEGRHLGVASNYLAQLKAGDSIPLSLKPASHGFHLPEDPRIPIVMVCAGSGLAPFRGFLEERAMLRNQGQDVGLALLFFGCDHSEIDYLYRSELEEWERMGLVRLKPAFCLEPLDGVTFVQHKVWECRGEVSEALALEGIVYVCGEGRFMAPAVRRTLVQMHQDLKGVSEDSAKEWFQDLERSGHYREDVFA